MAKASAQTKKLLHDSSVIDARGETDTIRLWENYRDQALLWRAISLLQIPATFIALVFAIVVYNNSDITLNVPAKPLPGHYSASELPDAEFVSAGTEYVNLIATYQPAVARRQYGRAREMLKEPMLSRFDTEMMDVELRAIETTSRTQVFFVDPSKTTIIRDGNEVHVTLTGERLKIVAGKELPVVETKFTISMTTVPRNIINPYGIVIINAISENTRQKDNAR